MLDVAAILIKDPFYGMQESTRPEWRYMVKYRFGRAFSSYQTTSKVSFSLLLFQVYSFQLCNYVQGRK